MAFFMIEAQLTELGLRPLELAAGLGLEPVLVTNSAERYAELTSYDRIVAKQSRVLLADTNDAEAVCRALTDDPAEVSAVFTLCDYNLAIAAQACQHFELPSLRPAAARGAVDKLVSRRLLALSGVRTPAFVNVIDPADLDAALDLVGLPCVVKPMTDSASVGVLLCYTRAQAEEQLRRLTSESLNARGQRRPAGALVEQYVVGYEVSVESFYHEGSHRILGVTDKRIGGAPAFAEVADDFPSLLPRTRLALVEELAKNALAAIGHDFGAAHTEIRVSGEDAYVIEVNGRAGGDDISELVRRGTGVDVLRCAVQAAVGRQPDLTARPEATGVAWRALSAAYPGVLTATYGLEVARQMPGVVEVELHAPIGGAVSPLRSNHDIVGHVLAEAATGAEASRIADAALNHISLEITPQ